MWFVFKSVGARKWPYRHLSFENSEKTRKSHYGLFCSKIIFSLRRNIIYSNRYILLFAVDWRFEWYIKVGRKFSNKGVDGFARARDDCVSCLP
jgi:hypothetical protein